ncbi:hypothetical protein MD484_g8365, partial [Candolleomyces efflorescens]
MSVRGGRLGELRQTGTPCCHLVSNILPNQCPPGSKLVPYILPYQCSNPIFLLKLNIVNLAWSHNGTGLTESRKFFPPFQTVMAQGSYRLLEFPRSPLPDSSFFLALHNLKLLLHIDQPGSQRLETFIRLLKSPVDLLPAYPVHLLKLSNLIQQVAGVEIEIRLMPPLDSPPQSLQLSVQLVRPVSQTRDLSLHRCLIHDLPLYSIYLTHNICNQPVRQSHPSRQVGYLVLEIRCGIFTNTGGFNTARERLRRVSIWK